MSSDDLKYGALGDFILESGEALPDFGMSFLTRGALNTDRSNVILALHGLVADHTQLLSWAGSGAALDTDKCYVVLPDTLGVAALPTPMDTRSGRRVTE